MAAIFDHLIALFVGTSLLVALLFVQQRGQLLGINASLHHTAQTQAASFADLFERDVENVQGPARGGMTPRLTAEDGLTTHVQFHTLADPALGALSPLLAVTYRLEPTTTFVTINGTRLMTCRVARYANDGTGYVYTGSSANAVLDFDVLFFARDMTGETTNGDAPEDFGFVRVNLEAAAATPQGQANHQGMAPRANLTRQGFTFRLLGLAVNTDSRPAPGTAPDPDAPLPDTPSQPSQPEAPSPGEEPTGGSTTMGHSPSLPPSPPTPSLPPPPPPPTSSEAEL
ncbi:MAG: hypothetical protein HKN04_11215 [Rhodothermaceae bacterium]|nr:hypothetical protein [Rhodothermaceae bacterium]